MKRDMTRAERIAADEAAVRRWLADNQDWLKEVARRNRERMERIAQLQGVKR